ncbi:hypothetical protein BV22DRAFT_1047280 [Leucogyrophana mollusca]|uniref:Uncharacterized protein n=1 Tax=Leucogyrophana mollusca TaxID=85980 RepID=A0ACB8BIR9_9AGAM|nr:hypothetical protein BV22DRAFT_1047280 [Leucogyrophana mollusca]
MSGRISGSRGPSKPQYPEQLESSGRISQEDAQRALASSSYGPSAFAPHPFSRQPYTGADGRPQSSNSNMTTSSSLSGAIGHMNMPPQLRAGDPSLTKSRAAYSLDPSDQMSWMAGQHDQLTMPAHSTYVQHASSSAMSAGNPYQNAPYQGINTVTTHNASPESISPQSPAFPSAYTSHMTSQQSHTQHMSTRSGVSSPFSESYLGTPMMGLTRPPSQSSDLRPQMSRTRHASMEDEVHHLRKKVRELELVNQSDRMRIKELEGELAGGLVLPDRPYRQQESSSINNIASLIPPMPPQNAPIPPSWKARTEARIRLFCSLNRAGNALCSWHDSRRERRAYPPRMAPPGHLNCGCTYDEALFEESLSRHGVGSYHPGETVRMDPALRNPLLQLLQRRYGYRDGDFERDPVTGDWVEGEGHAYWEHKAMSGSLGSRKSRGEDRR